MTDNESRSGIYAGIADALVRTCMRSIDDTGAVSPQFGPGSISLGHVAYVLGELRRCRPRVDLTAIHGRNLVVALQNLIRRSLDVDNEIFRCFLSMGLGLAGPAGDDHLVLGGVDQAGRQAVRDALVVTREFDNNWEAFNGSVLAGRHLLYGDPPERVVSHLEKIATKYDATGYFDDKANVGNYNNYGLMSINYSLRVAELLADDEQVRRAIDTRFRPHALRYVDLVLTMANPRGECWPFGRSAGVLGQLQSIALLEQTLARGWLTGERGEQARSVAQLATGRMIDLYWDEERGWFSFRDEYQTAYDYRSSLPMAWDLLRYFLQIEQYAATDERSKGRERGLPLPARERHEEIVTNPDLKTAIYIWSDGRDHAVLPIMAGPDHVTGDSLARPYALGLFEWTTQRATPALCPRLTIEGATYWPTWHAQETTLSSHGDASIYHVTFTRLRSDAGNVCPIAIGCAAKFVFAPGRFERSDSWLVEEETELDYRLEVLQPSPHPRRPRFGPVHELAVGWESEIAAVTLTGRIDVHDDPAYRNYHGHSSHSWIVRGDRVRLLPGSYATRLIVEW